MIAKSEMAELLLLRSVYWPSAPELSDHEAELWRQIWDRAGVSAEEVQTALDVLGREEKFPPGPGIVAARAADLRVDEMPLADAWEEVLTRMRDRGWKAADRATDWGDPLIGQAVDVVGAEWIGISEDAPLSVKFAQFRQAWESLVARRRQDRKLAGVPGDMPRVAAARRRVAGTDFVRIGDALGEG